MGLALDTGSLAAVADGAVADQGEAVAAEVGVVRSEPDGLQLDAMAHALRITGA